MCIKIPQVSNDNDNDHDHDLDETLVPDLSIQTLNDLKIQDSLASNNAVQRSVRPPPTDIL